MSKQLQIIKLLKANQPRLQDMPKPDQKLLRNCVKGEELYWTSYVVGMFVVESNQRPVLYLPLSIMSFLEKNFNATSETLRVAKEMVLCTYIEQALDNMDYNKEAQADIAALATSMEIPDHKVDDFVTRIAGEVLSAYILDATSDTGVTNVHNIMITEGHEVPVPKKGEKMHENRLVSVKTEDGVNELHSITKLKDKFNPKGLSVIVDELVNIQRLFMAVPGVELSEEALTAFKVAQGISKTNAKLDEDEKIIAGAAVDRLTPTGKTADEGFLAITNKRVLFSGKKANKMVNLDKVNNAMDIDKKLSISLNTSGSALLFNIKAGAKLETLMDVINA